MLHIFQGRDDVSFLLENLRAIDDDAAQDIGKKYLQLKQLRKARGRAITNMP